MNSQNSHRKERILPSALSLILLASTLCAPAAGSDAGTLVVWGDGEPVGVCKVTAFAASEGGGVAVTDHHTLVPFRGGPGIIPDNLPSQITDLALQGVRAISAGWYHLAALKEDGTVQVWGDNLRGQSNVPPGLKDVAAISAGGFQTLALKRDHTVVFIEDPTIYRPRIERAVAIAAGLQHSVVVVGPPIRPRIISSPADQTVTVGTDVAMEVDARGTPPLYYFWFKNGERTTFTNRVIRLRADDHTAGFYSVQVMNELGTVASELARLAVLGVPYGKVTGWGDNSDARARAPIGLDSVRAVGAGTTFSVALKQDGTVAAWGISSHGETNVPAGLDRVKAISVGDLHVLALREDGTLVAWGDNEYGQGSVPFGLTGVKSIAAGGSHNLAILRDDTVIAWGRNQRGATNVPPYLQSVVAITAGREHSAALKVDGTVVAWGSNDHGETSVPAGLSNVVAIAAGGNHMLALKHDGTVVCWGRNDAGQCLPPILPIVTAIEAGYAHSLALTQDGRVVGWGSIVASRVPSTLRNVISFGAGWFHSLAVEGPPAPMVSLGQVGDELNLNLGLTPGWRYQFEKSSDFRAWTPVGDEFLAPTGAMTHKVSMDSLGEFIRLKTSP
ncbi:MAG TPA: hypothetical protein PLX89_04445 [Verrucomicrobiota bacterium]|nr:hypothetical protein [Verrucomicrobiales bacterium]HRI12235.1 hypothetical protein [Verrucomicrobiota bacterium]